jgi:uncharacterized protein (DUF2225 family)
MTTLVNIELTCPVCETRFDSHRIASTNSMGQDTDFRPRAAGLDPQPHYVHVCPRCLFAAFEGDYGGVEDSVREFVLSGRHAPEELVPGGQAASISGSVKYLLAARCYSEDTRASDLRLADLYLRASWCARVEGEAAREREAQCQSILLFEEALEAGEVADGQRRTILYLLGELYRRVSRYELALAMFDAAAEAPPPDEDDGRYEALVKRQRAAAEARLCDNMQIEGD